MLIWRFNVIIGVGSVDHFLIIFVIELHRIDLGALNFLLLLLPLFFLINRFRLIINRLKESWMDIISSYFLSNSAKTNMLVCLDLLAIFHGSSICSISLGTGR